MEFAQTEAEASFTKRASEASPFLQPSSPDPEADVEKDFEAFKEAGVAVFDCRWTVHTMAALVVFL